MKRENNVPLMSFDRRGRFCRRRTLDLREGGGIGRIGAKGKVRRVAGAASAGHVPKTEGNSKNSAFLSLISHFCVAAKRRLSENVPLFSAKPTRCQVLTRTAAELRPNGRVLGVCSSQARGTAFGEDIDSRTRFLCASIMPVSKQVELWT